MELVKNLSEIIANITTLDEYLQDPAKQDFALKLIKDGVNFIAVKKDGGYRFYPSRYIGYKDNNHEAHLKYNLEEGKDANPIISQILKHNPKASQDMETAYKAYCEELGFMAAEKGNGGTERRFWIIGLEE
jgi:hypothetical protein